VGVGCDGATALLGIRNGMVVQLSNLCSGLFSVHCFAHRFALACLDAVSNNRVKILKDCERILCRLWCFFHSSPKMSNYLNVVQEKRGNPVKKLKQQFLMRWLYSERAVEAAFNLIIEVWEALVCYFQQDVKRLSFLYTFYTEFFLCWLEYLLISRVVR
jgi:hypothetical protein